MTISEAKKLNSDGVSGRGPDKTNLPHQDGLITIISGDTESEVIDIRGLRSVGMILPASIGGVTTVSIHVSSKIDGTYAKLASDGEFTLDELKAVGSAYIVEWNFMKVVYDAAATGSASIPLSFA